MEELMFHFRQTGHTVKQVLLGITAFDTIEPANLEAVLSSKFKGIEMTAIFAIGKIFNPQID